MQKMKINMRKFKVLSVVALVAAAGVILNACKEEFLEVTPKGALDGSVLATTDGVDALLIGAYSMLDGISSQGTGGWEAASSNWVFGSIRGMEANKGTDAGDQPDINPIQTYSEPSNNPYLNLKWRSLYEGISRCNNVIEVANQALEGGSITDEEHTSFVNQARALRGYYHFEAWRMWDGMIPYLDEETDFNTVTNMEDVRPQILADLQAGTSLPNNMGQIGRWNGTVARVMQAKALMQMNADYAGAQTLLQQVVDSGTKPDGSEIGLETFYGDIFDAGNRNGLEAVYTVQYGAKF